MFWLELPCGRYIDLHTVGVIDVRKTVPTARLAFVLHNGAEYTVECASVAEAQTLRHKIVLTLTCAPRVSATSQSDYVAASIIPGPSGLDLYAVTRGRAENANQEPHPRLYPPKYVAVGDCDPANT